MLFIQGWSPWNTLWYVTKQVDRSRAFFQLHFLTHAVSERPLLLMLDGHSPHYTLELVKAATAKDVILFCNLSTTTHYCWQSTTWYKLFWSTKNILVWNTSSVFVWQSRSCDYYVPVFFTVFSGMVQRDEYQQCCVVLEYVHLLPRWFWMSFPSQSTDLPKSGENDLPKDSFTFHREGHAILKNQ